MIGSRVGIKAGLRVGLAAGLSADPIDPGGGILVVLMGDSQGESHAQASFLSIPNSQLTSAYPNIRMLSQQASVNTDPPTWQNSGPQSLQTTSFDLGGGAVATLGFELTLMRDLDRALPANKFAFARIAVGSSTLKASWPSTSNYPSTPPILYTQAITFIRNALSQLGCTSVVFLWAQGAPDAGTTTDGTNYEAELTAFIAALRSSLGGIGPLGGEIPFVFTKANTNWNPATFLGLTQIRTSQTNVAANVTHTSLVSLDSINPSDPGQHYGPNQYITAGHLVSPSIASFCGVRVQPVASFTAGGTGGRSAGFTDTSVSYGDTITSWLWTFGDGGNSTLQNPSHTYAADGSYQVTLRITNSAGDSSTVTQTVTVANSQVAGVTYDMLSGWATPVSGAECASFLTNISVATTIDGLYLMQEDPLGAASANPVDQIGGLSLTATANLSYLVAAPGMTRAGISMADNTARGLSTTSASLPDISTTSFMVIAIVRMPTGAPAAARSFLGLGANAATRCAIILQTTGKLGVQSTTSNITNSTNTYVDGAVHLIALQCNRTAGSVTMFTETEKVSPTFGAGMTGKGLFVGTEAANCPGITVVYLETLFGAHAELSSANMKTLFQSILIGAVPWS